MYFGSVGYSLITELMHAHLHLHTYTATAPTWSIRYSYAALSTKGNNYAVN